MSILTSPTSLLSTRSDSFWTACGSPRDLEMMAEVLEPDKLVTPLSSVSPAMSDATPASAAQITVGELSYLTPSPYTASVSTQPSVTSSVSGAEDISPAVQLRPDRPKGSSAGNTPGDCVSLSMKALAAQNRVRWAEQVVSAGKTRRNSAIAGRPATPYPIPKIMTPEKKAKLDQMNNPQTSSTCNWLSPESEVSQTEVTPQLLKLRAERRGTVPAGSTVVTVPTVPTVVVTPALSLTTVRSFDARQSVSSVGSFAVDPSPIVSDFSGGSQGVTPRSSRLQSLPSPALLCQLPSPGGVSRGSTMTEDRDSAISGLGVRSSVSGSGHNESANRGRCPSGLHPVTPSSYVRPRSPGRSPRTEASESGIDLATGTGSSPRSLPSPPEFALNASQQLPVYSTGIKVIKTIILALANFTTALCLSILGPTIPSLMTSHNLDLLTSSLLVTSRSAGGVLGVLLLYRFFDDVTPFMSFTLALLVSGGLTVAFPFIVTDVGLNISSFFIGVSLAFLFCASGAVCLHIWSRNYMTGLFFTQLMLSVGLAAGPLLCQPFLLQSEPQYLTNYVNSSDPAISIEAIINANMSPTVTPYPYDVTNSTSAPTTTWLPPSPFYFIYVISGVAQVFVGLLFMTLWLRTKEPTFFDRVSSFDFSRRKRMASGDGGNGWERFYSVCLTLSLALLSLGQLGMEMAYQVLLVSYLRDSWVMGLSSSLYVLAAHHGAYLGGRVLGGVDGSITGPVPVLMFDVLIVITAFVVQLFFTNTNVMVIWGVAVGAGFSMGSMMPSVVNFVEKTRPINRQVAGAILTSSYVGMGTLTGVTGVLMQTTFNGFEMVLLVTSVVCAILLCTVFTSASRLADCLNEAIPKSILTEFAMDPNQNIISPDEKGGKRKRRVVDANGNVVESSSRVARQSDGSRVRGEPCHMLSFVSLGTRAVVGRW